MGLLKFLKKEQERPLRYDERLGELLNQTVAECDVEPMKRFLADLDEYGLNYYFHSNISAWMKVSGSEVTDRDGSKQKKKYTITVWGVNLTKALKSPAFWNSFVADQSKKGLGGPVSQLCPSLCAEREAISRTFDQLSIMWGHSFIGRGGLLTAPLFEGLEIYTKYSFEFCENGGRRDSIEPIIELINSIG